MKPTCNHTECKLHDLLGGEPSQCPHYIESWWTAEGKEPILIKDCSTKRLFLMVQELHNRLIGVQKASEQERNAMLRFVKTISETKNNVSIEINDDNVQQSIAYDNDTY